jgi:uncharacterized protein YraI
MKRYFIIILLSVICLLNLDAGVRFTTVNLHLRQGPGLDYQIEGIIPFGTYVTIDEDCNCKWICVEYHGQIGYVSSKYLSKTYYSHRKGGKSVYQKHLYHNKNIRYYVNSYGQRVQSPTYYQTGTPSGATAICQDGTYSFSRSHSGTCSHHGGVATWL